MNFDFKPFNSDTQVLSLGPDSNLTVENGQESINFYGEMNIENKAESRERLDELIELFTRIRDALPKK